VPHLTKIEPVLEFPTLSPLDSYTYNHALASEGAFRRLLCLERKRAERSGRRLVLLLLEGDACRGGDRKLLLANVAACLSRSSRETDMIGWYRENDVLGVLFTEVAAADPSTVDILSRRVSCILVEALGLDDARGIKASFHVFPDDGGGQDCGRRAFSVLYPEAAQNRKSKRLSFAAKRFVDVSGSLALLVLLLPLLLLIACAVKLTSKGPVLFRQYRLGQFGEIFPLLKFRSMHATADQSIHEQYVKHLINTRGSVAGGQSGCAEFKLKNDPRITKIGAVLRQTSLDELPQLINVLSGKMSLVGPRPPLPYEFAAYHTWHRRRLLSKPGMTGLWQVRGRSRVTFDDMVRMDLQYASKWSLWLDINILMYTPRAVLSCSGAY